MRPFLWPDSDDGLLPSDPYVRRFWCALIGPGAVIDLLRMIRAAESGRTILRPTHTALLATEDLVRKARGRLEVRATVPLLSDAHRRRLHPLLQRELAGL